MTFESKKPGDLAPESTAAITPVGGVELIGAKLIQKKIDDTLAAIPECENPMVASVYRSLITKACSLPHKTLEAVLAELSANPEAFKVYYMKLEIPAANVRQTPPRIRRESVRMGAVGSPERKDFLSADETVTGIRNSVVKRVEEKVTPVPPAYESAESGSARSTSDVVPAEEDASSVFRSASKMLEGIVDGSKKNTGSGGQ